MSDLNTQKTLIVRRPLSEQVYQLLEDRILAGTIAPGTKLAEEAIAEEFGVSRSPAREAISQLEKVGLAEKSGPRDRRVVIPSRKIIIDVYATWIILETGPYLSVEFGRDQGRPQACPRNHARHGRRLGRQ